MTYEYDPQCHRLTVQIFEDDWVLIQRVARKDGMTPSAWIKNAIHHAVADLRLSLTPEEVIKAMENVNRNMENRMKKRAARK